MQCGREICLSRVRDSGVGLLARGACDTLRQKAVWTGVCANRYPPMNVTTIPRTSPRMGLRVFVLMLAWVVMAGLSWADFDWRAGRIARSTAGCPVGDRAGFDELQDDATTMSSRKTHFRQRMCITRPQSVPPFRLLRRTSAADHAICSPNSPSIDCNPSNSVWKGIHRRGPSFGAGRW